MSTRFAMIGGGWRAEFFLRITRALPDGFECSDVLVRDPAKAQAFTHRWQVPAVSTLDELLRARPPFVVVAVPWAAAPGLVRELADRGVPALVETPPAPDLAGLEAICELQRRGACVQVAEQYAFQPLHAARLAVVASGRLGRVSQAQVSAAHGYHGTSLIRKLLCLGAEPATIRAATFRSPLVDGPGRDGPPAAEQVSTVAQTLAWLDYGDRLGVFDFTGAQYFSWVRSPRVLVRGERGEINQQTVRWLQDYRTPLQADLVRRDTGHEGNLEGWYHEGYLLGGEWVYRNPVIPGRLSDDEIAIATCLQKMAEHVAGGPSFYSLAEAAQDHYLGLKIDEAARTGETVTAAPMGWADLVPAG